MSDANTASGQGKPKQGGPFQALVANLFDLGLTPHGRGLRFWELLSIVGFVGAMVAIAIYTWPNPVTFGILALVGAAAWLSGGVLGFLFGVPRLRTAVDASTHAGAGFAPNTNLEQISDWLTKIIVGATLVQLRPLVADIDAIALSIGADLGIRGGATAAGAVMVTYFFGGFMWGYLWCSLRIFREMAGLIAREQAVASRESAVHVAGGHV